MSRSARQNHGLARFVLVVVTLLFGLLLAADGRMRTAVSEGAGMAQLDLLSASPSTQGPSQSPAATDAVETDGAQITIVKQADPADGADFTFSSNIPPERGASIITTVAGDGARGFGGDGGLAASAQLSTAFGVAVDSAGNLFIADTENYRIRKVDAVTGIISTVAGDGAQGFGGDGGPATSAQLNFPFDVAVDGAGNLFIADGEDNRIRKVDGVTGIITTIAGDGTADFSGDGGPATSAQLNAPVAVELDSAGNLFIADGINHRIRKVDGVTGIITTVAGDGTEAYGGDGGPATSAQLNVPIDVTVDDAGNLYIADLDNHVIRKVDAVTGIISTVAGDGTQGIGGDGGPATSAQLLLPYGVAVDSAGNLYIAVAFNHRIRKVDGVTGIITTVAGDGTFGFRGDGGPATRARLYAPADVTVDGAGNLLIADTANGRIRKVEVGSFRLDHADPDDGDRVRQSVNFSNLPAGSYVITENVPIGWMLDRADCSGGLDGGTLNGNTLTVVIGAREETTCTFNNVESNSIVWLPLVLR